MPERYVAKVYESSEYDRAFNIYHYLYVILNRKTVNAYNINDNDMTLCKVMRIFEMRTDYDSGIRSNAYILVSKVYKDFEFGVFSYTSNLGGKMHALKISQSFIESAGVREGDYIDFNLLLLKKGQYTIPIYPETERLGDKPYDFNDSDFEGPK